ncbi:hypothetical protein D9758_009269 [Tetrapyrgos nigripes]|uniref:Nephrocystin 3-like N-terminal domain-containing protein n=1 Tax=Tetrapyrgos nigripes TaxID=182062 RepID=A0A8H5D277_9AGAR|nr:hypothetical protein D9758_009269 [Tetrapyrgos nigripes]
MLLDAIKSTPLLKIQKSASLKLLYQTIAHVGAFHDSETRYPPPKCHPETRTAVLSDISSWILRDARVGARFHWLYGPAGAGRGAEAETPVHWLYGPAGAGKSAIAQTLAEREQRNHLAASFFFSRSDPSRNNPKSLIMVISYCLAIWCRNSRLRAAIDDAVKTQPAILGSNIEHQFQELVVKPFGAIPKESWKMLPRVVIIDGLDECQGSDSQRRVLNTLFGGLGNQTPLRFLIASRPEPMIRDFFGQLPHRGITTRTDLSDDYSTSRDIEVYLRDGFKAIMEESHSDVMAHIALPWPPIGVIHDLVQRASGQFIYASTVLKYVGAEYSLPVERLELVLGLPLGDPDAFSELDVLYQQILSSNRNKARVIQILGTILVIEDTRSKQRVELGLTRYWGYRVDDQKVIGMVEQLLSLPIGAVTVSLRGMHSVLQIDSGIVKFRHKSFLDFLFDARRSGEYSIDKALFHEQLARVCMKITIDSSDSLRSYASYNCLTHIHLAKSTTDLVSELRCFNFCGMIESYLRDQSHHMPHYVSQSIPVCQKYAEALESHQIKTLSDSLQLGIYVADTDRRELSKEFLSYLELLFALAMDCHYTPPYAPFPRNTRTSSNVDILVGLGCTISFLPMKEIFLCPDPRLHSHSHSTASCNPIWHFIDFERGYRRLAKHCLRTIRHNPSIKNRTRRGPSFSLKCGYIYAQSRVSELLYYSPLNVKLQHELKKTIPYLHGTKELHKVLLWLQDFPDDQRDIEMEVAIQRYSEQFDANIEEDEDENEDKEDGDEDEDEDEDEEGEDEDEDEDEDDDEYEYEEDEDENEDEYMDTIVNQSHLDSWRANRVNKAWVW